MPPSSRTAPPRAGAGGALLRPPGGAVVPPPAGRVQQRRRRRCYGRAAAAQRGWGGLHRRPLGLPARRAGAAASPASETPVGRRVAAAASGREPAGPGPPPARSGGGGWGAGEASAAEPASAGAAAGPRGPGGQWSLRGERVRGSFAGEGGWWPGGGVSGTAGARGCQRPRAWGVSSVLSPRLGLARPLSGLRSSWRVGEKGRCEELAKPSLPSGPRRARAASPRVQNQRSGVF